MNVEILWENGFPKWPAMRNSQPPKVSVSVVTFNHGDWLAECLSSIVNQVTDFSFEIVVGDDASTDGHTREILKDFADRYPDIVHPIYRDKNVGAARNYFDVVSCCRGEYIAHIDGDDRMLPGKLQKQADFLDMHPQCAIAVHEVRVFDDETGVVLRDRLDASPPPKFTNIDYLVDHGCFFAHLSKMYRRSAIKTSCRSQFTVDFFLHIEHARSGLIGFIDEVLGEYRRHGSSITQSSNRHYLDVIKGHLDAYDLAIQLGVDLNRVERARCRFRYVNAMQAFKRNDIGLFKKLIRLRRGERKYASARHLTVAAMSCFPGVLKALWQIYR